MADEAVTPGPDGEPARRWGANGYAGEWVRATDAGTGDRARWIDDDVHGGAPSRAADTEQGSAPTDA
jgi:hypothetical protein